MHEFSQAAGDILRRIRSARPIIHSLTNYVVMNSTANVLLAMGASPIMAHDPEELEELVAISGAVVINIGTLSQSWIPSFLKAANLCGRLGKPFVLDPVGSGATMLRTGTARRIIEAASPAAIRCNASEALSLADEGSKTRGVDAGHSIDDAAPQSASIATALGTTLAVTGERDVVTDGRRVLTVTGGHALLARVTGTGCAASVITAAFLSQEEDTVLASAAALAFFGLAGERAAETASAPGSFWTAVLDHLYLITPEELSERSRIEAT